MTYSTTHTPPEELDTFTHLTDAHDGFQKGEAMTQETRPAVLVALKRVQAERGRQQREEADDIAEHIAHDAQFMTVGEFGLEIVSRHHLPQHEAWPLAYEVLKSHPGLELFCRWVDSFRWSPLPPCPVMPASRLRDKNWRYYNGKFGHMGPTYMHPVRCGAIPSPDPLGSTLGQCRGTGWWPTDCLAIRRDVAERLLGSPAPADDVESTSEHPPAPAVVNPEPAPEPEQPPSPAWKIDGKWTPEAKDEMRQQRRDGMSETDIAAHWRFSRSNLTELIGSLRNPKD